MQNIVFFFCLHAYFFKQEFSDPRDADDARYHLDGKDFDGSRIIVEFAKGVSFLTFLWVNYLMASNK